MFGNQKRNENGNRSDGKRNGI